MRWRGGGCGADVLGVLPTSIAEPFQLRIFGKYLRGEQALLLEVECAVLRRAAWKRAASQWSRAESSVLTCAEAHCATVPVLFELEELEELAALEGLAALEALGVAPVGCCSCRTCSGGVSVRPLK